MLRRHLNDIVYLTLLLAFAIPYGVFVGAIQAPLWLHLVMTGVACLVIAVAVDPLSRVNLRQLEDRARVRHGQGGAS
ncbi:hypothetical protein ACWCQM_11720 [Streptomyces sp. NPDC002125]